MKNGIPKDNKQNVGKTQNRWLFVFCLQSLGYNNNNNNQQGYGTFIIT